MKLTDNLNDFNHPAFVSWTSHSALWKELASSVAFYGNTSLHVDETGTINLASNELKFSEEEKLFLVFERASEGNPLDFMEQRLKDVTREESWFIVIDALISLATLTTFIKLCYDINSIATHFLPYLSIAICILKTY